MAISSASHIYDQPDPILETDLELLAKVNTYEQAKYDQGAQVLNNEIDKWSQLANVAKPQDRDYINAKLNKLVSGINGLGGVNLSDPNNVNAVKSLGYNMYGDNVVMNAAITTGKLQQFQRDAQGKLSGKNAKDYDPVNYEYNLNKWNSWLQDGQTGSSFDGPTSLNAGSFDNYNQKINTAISKLTPDIDEAPTGPDAINYLQVGSKFIRKERISGLIDSLTDANDHAIIEAHAWKNLGGVADNDLVKLTIDGYNSKIDSIKRDYNTIKHNYAQTQDFDQKQRYKEQLDQLNGAIKSIDTTKQNLYADTNGKSINDDQRNGLRQNLYFDSYKSGLSNALSYQQNKTELKMNAGKAFQLKEAREAFQFSQTMNWRSAQFKLDVRKQDFTEKKTLAELGLLSGIDGSISNTFGLQGPSAGAPLAIMPNLGKDDATKFGENSVTDANANYAASATNFYNEAYNNLGSLPDYQQYVTKNAAGNFVPKDAKSEQFLQQAIKNKLLIYDNIGTLPLSERTKYEKELSSDDVTLLRNYKNLKESELYKQEVNDLEDQAFRNSTLESPAVKKLYIAVPDGKGGYSTNQMSLRQFKNLQDSNSAEYKQLKDAGAVYSFKPISEKDVTKQNNRSSDIVGKFDNIITNTLDNVTGTDYENRDVKFTPDGESLVKEYYDKAQKGWDDVSKNYSVYGKNVSLPTNKVAKENLVKYLGDKVREQALTNKDKSIVNDVNDSDIDINRIWVQYDGNATGSKLRYKAEIKYKKGDKKEGDKLYKVDLTDDILNNPNSTITGFYPKDNWQIIYGLTMDKDGVTPLSADDNYTSALETTSNPALTHKFQIVARKNPSSSTLDENFRVNLLVPKRDASGKVTYTTQPVKNFWDKVNPLNFPNSFENTVRYMNEWFQTPEKAKQFYQLNGIPEN